MLVRLKLKLPLNISGTFSPHAKLRLCSNTDRWFHDRSTLYTKYHLESFKCWVSRIWIFCKSPTLGVSTNTFYSPHLVHCKKGISISWSIVIFEQITLHCLGYNFWFFFFISYQVCHYLNVMFVFFVLNMMGPNISTSFTEWLVNQLSVNGFFTVSGEEAQWMWDPAPHWSSERATSVLDVARTLFTENIGAVFLSLVQKFLVSLLD